MSEKKKNKGSTILIIVLVLAIIGFIGYKAYGMLNQPTDEEASDNWEDVVFEGQKDTEGYNAGATAALYTAYSDTGLKPQSQIAGLPYMAITQSDSTTGPNYFDVSKIRLNKSLGIVEVTIASTVDSSKYVVWRVCKSAKYDCSGDSRKTNGNTNGVSCYYDEKGLVRKLLWVWDNYSYSIIISDSVEDGDNPFNDSLIVSDLTCMAIE